MARASASTRSLGVETPATSTVTAHDGPLHRHTADPSSSAGVHRFGVVMKRHAQTASGQQYQAALEEETKDYSDNQCA